MYNEYMNSGLKFLTLNCWGLPFLTPFKDRRLDAISEIIRNGKWDVVALQEVWLKRDQQRIIKKACFPHHVAFDKGYRFFGSGGLMILSKYKILEHDFHTFIVKGFPHRLHEGDFHAAKGIGYALLDTPMGKLPIFTTHLIAKYARRQENDINRVFRMAQMLELILYIRRKATPSGFVLCGDLNATEADLELETLYALTGVSREWRMNLRSFRKRLDHIMCGATLANMNFRIANASLVLRSSFSSEKIPYSDHEGVSALIRPAEASVTALGTKRILERTLRYMKYSMHAVRQLDDWIRCLPLAGPLSSHFMAPQFTYIEALVNMVETELKANDSKHPLGLNEVI